VALECNKFSAEEYFRSICGGNIPPGLIKLFQSLESQAGQEIFCMANAIGGLEPLSFTRPGAGELVQVYDKMITVPAATIDTNGKIVPRDGKLIQICAPEGKVLVIRTLRARAEDLTAAQSGNIAMKRLAVVGFSEGFCPAGEPADGDDLGTFQNIEHVLLPSKAGFDVYGRNNSPFGPATFSIHGEMWETC
jgi:hypothetical protein